jgi:hypothetical protein
MLQKKDFPKMKKREFPKMREPPKTPEFQKAKEYVPPRMEKYERFLQERRKYDSD